MLLLSAGGKIWLRVKISVRMKETNYSIESALYGIYTIDVFISIRAGLMELTLNL